MVIVIVYTVSAVFRIVSYNFRNGRIRALHTPTPRLKLKSKEPVPGENLETGVFF